MKVLWEGACKSASASGSVVRCVRGDVTGSTTGTATGKLMSGFTENYIKVHAPFDRMRVNTIEEVVVGGVISG